MKSQETLPIDPNAPLGVALEPAVRRLQGHVAMMAPHQRDRHAAKLITEATDRLVILEGFIASLLNPEENGYAVTAHVRDQARKLLGVEPCEVKPPNAPDERRSE